MEIGLASAHTALAGEAAPYRGIRVGRLSGRLSLASAIGRAGLSLTTRGPDPRGCSGLSLGCKDFYCSRFFTICRQGAVTPVKQNEIMRPSPQVDAATFCNLVGSVSYEFERNSITAHRTGDPCTS